MDDADGQRPSVRPSPSAPAKILVIVWPLVALAVVLLMGLGVERVYAVSGNGCRRLVEESQQVLAGRAPVAFGVQLAWGIASGLALLHSTMRGTWRARGISGIVAVLIVALWSGVLIGTDPLGAFLISLFAAPLVLVALAGLGALVWPRRHDGILPWWIAWAVACTVAAPLLWVLTTGNGEILSC